MRYAIKNGEKTEPTPGATAICQCCNSPLIAKCGAVKVWHWAHKTKEHCDKWYTPMTQWHKDWQDLFPEEYREVVMFDENTGEKHIADIRLPSGVVIEFQHSNISATEIASRECFYKKMIWVVDLSKTQNRAWHNTTRRGWVRGNNTIECCDIVGSKKWYMATNMPVFFHLPDEMQPYLKYDIREVYNVFKRQCKFEYCEDENGNKNCPYKECELDIFQHYVRNSDLMLWQKDVSVMQVAPKSKFTDKYAPML